MQVPIQLAEPTLPRRPPPQGTGWPLLRLGFRPFYLLAAAQAVFAVLLWGGQIAWGWPAGGRATPLWHAHEMVFGFALAVIVGFLFTAGRNWSGQPTPTGAPLAALALLWLAARGLAFTPWLVAGAMFNLLFALLAAAALARALHAGGNTRNLFFAALLALMGLASFAVHAAEGGWFGATLPAWAGVGLALDVVLFMLAVMGGRVIPMFTNNGVPGAGAVRHAALERVALGALLVLPLAALAGLRGAPMALLCGVAAAAHAARWALWRPWRTLRQPIVWVLHAAYAWLWVHLALRGLAALDLVPASIAAHALTAGAAGGLIIGMVTRTARGHTARPLKADAWDVAAYAAVLAGALLRVAGPALWPAQYATWVSASAALWAGGFALYLVHYAPWLARPRLDGRDG
jgi:uncharacterized protein involved in response to NO